MLNSNLAVKLRSRQPLAIVPHALEKFLCSVHEANEDGVIRKALNKMAYSPRVEPKFAIIDANADADDDHMMALKLFGNERAPYVTPKGTGVICIHGVIGKNLSLMEKMIGCTDVNDIQAQLRAWKKDTSVKRVMLKINSGGGTTTGLEETAKMIYEYEKDTFTFTDDDMGSAAFWLGSQAKRVFTTASSSIGSVGIYVSITDETKKFEDEGKEVIMIKAGIYKGAGVDGVPLSKAQGDYLQGEVDELHGRFKRDIRRARPFIKDQDMEGQSFYGDIAASKGFATAVVSSWEEALAEAEGSTEDEINELISPTNETATLTGARPVKSPQRQQNKIIVTRQ
jgi:ClpP class serine protease